MSSDTNEQHQQQTADITNLQENFLQQQEKISALKELVRKSGAAHGSNKSAAQEKVKSIAERLKVSKAKSRQGSYVMTYSTEAHSIEVPQCADETASFHSITQKTTKPNSSSTPNPTPIKPVVQYKTPGSEKFALMRQQLEENKLRMAQKASSKQHLEQLVSQLKEKFDSTQQSLEDASELGRSMTDLSSLIHAPASRERHKSATDLSSQSFSLEKERIKFLENRCRLLEKQLDKEKQGKQSYGNDKDMENRIKELENTLAKKENELEANANQHREELSKLRDAAANKDMIKNHGGSIEIFNLKEQLARLSNENTSLMQEIENLNKKIEQNTSGDMLAIRSSLLQENQQLKQQLDSYTKNSRDPSELLLENESLKKDSDTQLKRIHELNEINDVLETARYDLSSKNTQLEEQVKQLQSEMIVYQEKVLCWENKYSQLERLHEQSKMHDTDSQVKAEMAKQILELKDEIAEIRCENRQLQERIKENEKLEVNDSFIAEKISSLESTIESQREDLFKSQESLKKKEEELMEKTIELNVLDANFKVLMERHDNLSKRKPLFSSSVAGSQDKNNPELEAENQQLKQKLDESNKAMIKLKLKYKQTEKQIEKLKKGSELHLEVVRLTNEKDSLQQKLTVLEEEKGQWQLSQMVEVTCKHETEFRNYEQQIDSLSTALKEKDLQLDALQKGEQTRVTSELIEIQLEEQVKELSEEVKSLRNGLEKREMSLKTLNERFEAVQQQKEELDKKLEHYLNENIELLDKVEKLSKSSSSAESIEIVERFTQQEKQELEEFNKRLEIGECSAEASSLHKDAVNELTQTEMNPEITDSLNKLREESSELMSKIELFTTERREVLEKMDNLNCENNDLLQRIEDITQEKTNLESQLEKAKTKHDDLANKLQAAHKEKDALTLQVTESKSQKNQLSQELTSLQQSSEVMAALDNSETLFDKCEKSLSKLSCELDAYRKAHDKKSKFNVSKKLAKEAENAHSQLSELLQKVKEASSAVETVTVVETVVAVTASNGKALAEYEQLTAQNRELKATIAELRNLLDEARDAEDDDKTDNRFAEERPPAIKPADPEHEKRLKEAVKQNVKYETQLTELQSHVEDLTRELNDARTGVVEKSEEISKLSDEIGSLRKLSDDFDHLANNKEMQHEKHIEQLTRLRKELESKCDTYEHEMVILQTLIAEQKQQLIEAYKEHEHEMNVKLLALQQQDEEAKELRQEIADLKQMSVLAGSELATDLQNECRKLQEALKINKLLVQEQIEDLAYKQETIDSLNQQITDLYNTMETNAKKVIEKEDELTYLQELYDSNRQHTTQLEIKLKELESTNQQAVLAEAKTTEKLAQAQAGSQEMLLKCQGLEQRNKEQLDKLKKYAANLKKKALQCQDLEQKLKESQTKSNDPQEVIELRNVNFELQNQMQKLHGELSIKVEELSDLANVRNILEKEVKQLKLLVDKKQSPVIAINSNLQEVEKSDWIMDSDELEQLQQELTIVREQLRMKTQESEEFKQLLSTAQSYGVQLEKQTHAELQVAQNTILKLQGQLTAVQQETSDWGDSFGTDDQLREELTCTQENLRLKVREIEDLRQSLMAAQEQQTAWGNESSSVKSADHANLSKVLEDKSAKLEKVEAIVDELENEIMALRERDHESQQQINELNTSLKLASAGQNQQTVVETLKSQLMSQENKIQGISEELKAKSIKFEKSKAVIKERNGQIQRLQAQLKDLQAKMTSLPEEEVISPRTQSRLEATPTPSQQNMRSQLDAAQEEYKRLNDKYMSEKSNFQETITRLETLHDGIQAKLQEDMAYIETLEQENAKFKDKICRLEECVACFEERRASMERKVNCMDAQLQSSTEEHAKAEDELIYRLNMLSEHDEVIAQRLIDSQSDKEEVEENFRQLQTKFNELQSKYKKLEREYVEYKTESSNEYEQELTAVREKLSKTEIDIDRQKSVYDGKLAAKTTELDELECELSDQLEKLNSDKRELAEQLEKMTDDCSAHQNDILRLQENLNSLEQAKSELERESSWLRMQSESSQQDLFELQELRMQSMQDKTEIENLRHQIESLASNHENELQALRTQIAELDTLRMQVGQNQTDDQVFIETENKRLTDLLAEKETVIENYQRQNLQLQMAAAAANAAHINQPDPFALSYVMHPPQTAAGSSGQSVTDVNEIERLRQELNEKNALVSRLQQDLARVRSEFNAVVVEGNQEIQRQIIGQELEATNYQTLQSAAATAVLSEGRQSTNDVIPAPPMFFTAESSARSPFDDIIISQQHHHGENTAGQLSSSIEQPTIEDLQRNVSDLEKHAQDLEHKLSMRNQRELDLEERLRDLEQRFAEKDHAHQHGMRELKTVRDDQQNQIDCLQRMLQNSSQELETLRQEHSKLLEEEHLKKTVKSVDRQIVSVDPAVQPTLDMFFGNAPAQEFEPFIISETSTVPVVEEIIVAKKTYECHPPEQMLQAPEILDAALDIGDGWGDSWGNNEAAAEADHFAKQTESSAPPVSLVPREQMLEIQIQELNEHLQEMQLSLERSEDQKKELHIKSGKLMKKLKEYKMKMDELQLSSHSSSPGFRKSSSVESSNSMFGDLDAAIQDEMKNQIKALEMQLKEQAKLHENTNAEKEKLLKRIDVLTAGNDRMADMKERQDMEVQMYQSRITELQQKLKTLDDWGNGESSSEPIPAPSTGGVLSSDNGLQKKIDELTLEVQDLTGDRLELQALLEEEKLNTQRSEQLLASVRQQLSTVEEHKMNVDNTYTNNLKIELQNLRESYNTLTDVNNKLSTDFRSQSEILALSQANELKLQTELDTLQAEVENLRETLIKTKQSLIDLESELSALKQQKEKQLDAVISGVDVQIQPDGTSFHEVDHLKSQISLLEGNIQQLSEENNILKSTKVPSEQLSKQQTLEELEDRIKCLEFENAQLKQTARGAAVGGEDLSVQLQERESEIMHLKQRINDLMNEDQTEKLVLEILTKNQEIQMLKMEVKHLEDDKHEMENNLSLQLTKEMQASKELQQSKETVEVESLLTQIEEFKAEKRQMEEELHVLNNHVLESLHQEEKMKCLTLELDTKDIQIAELRKTVMGLQNNVGADASVNYETINSQWEAIVEQRCSEIAKMWQDHLTQKEQEFKVQEDRLHKEINSLRANSGTGLSMEPAQKMIALETTTSSSNAASEESTSASGSTSADASQVGTPLRIRSSDNDNEEDNGDAIIEKMQTALESQEMEIVTLKEQLAIRSAEYARLAAQYDPFKLQNTMSHIGVVESRKTNAPSSEAAVVPKSELDLAMYMLHQRDMRCEEMTLELVSLLEERDTLQLKLSNTLRQVEAIKSQAGGVTQASASTDLSVPQTGTENILNLSVAGSTVESENDELNRKLSQLHTVSHSKDKLIKEEREQRSRQLEKLQQDVAKMPPAAVSELLGTDMSQTNQSPSTVLLNWLWGNKGSNVGASQPDF